jgi:hypothetical protein
MKEAFKTTAVKPERETTEQNVQADTSMILDEKNVREEVAAFNAAWKGSIEYQASVKSMLAETAMPVDDLLRAMSILLSSIEEKASPPTGAAKASKPWRRERRDARRPSVSR